MRCSSYCTASEYNTSDLTTYFQNKGSQTQLFDDVLYVQIQDRSKKKNIDIFIFSFGCVSIWGGDEVDAESILKTIADFEVNKIDNLIMDFILYEYHKKPSENNKTFIDEENNSVVLADNSELVKLSISHALAQSVKLRVLEDKVSDILAKADPIQQELANTGGVSLSKTEISKQIGNLFNARYSVNLHSDILDTPEFFWRRPRHEVLYLMTSEFQDINVRHGILNHRLNIIQELYNILSNELNYKHSTRLEVTIVVLISIEIIIALIKMI